MRVINDQMKDVAEGTKTANEIVAEGVDEYAITYFSTAYETKEMADAFRAIRDAYNDCAKKAPVEINNTEENVIRCDCGHSCAKSLVMSTSSGSSCPDCYDQMSL